jgi:hypothetical protein
VTPAELLDAVAVLLWRLAGDAVTRLTDPLGLGKLPPDPDPGPVLGSRLLAAVALPAGGGPLADAVRTVLGDLGPGATIQLHGWQRDPGGARGIALVCGTGASRAVVAVVPGAPELDVVCTGKPDFKLENGDWQLELATDLPAVWDASIRPGAAPSVRQQTAGTVTLTLSRTTPVELGHPGLALSGLAAKLVVDVASATPQLEVRLDGFSAAVVPAGLTGLLGSAVSAQATVTINLDRANGLRFGASGTSSLSLPSGLSTAGPGAQTFGAAGPAPQAGGISSSGIGVELALDGTDLKIAVRTSLTVEPPGLPLRVRVDGIGLELPVALSGDRIGPAVDRLTFLSPAGLDVELNLPPVKGGGTVKETGPGVFAGILDLDLSMLQVQAVGVLRLPGGGAPLSFLLLMYAKFPPPGLEIGLGFAIDAVGGLVGIGHRADGTVLRGLVADGNVDRILFPADPLNHSAEIIGSLIAGFPESRGRFVIGPMVRITWGAGGLVSISAAVVLDLPAPVQFLLLGRMLIALPHPDVPLIHLQASVYGRFDPAVPSMELLVSLTGSWIVGIPVSGDIYLLIRGGDSPEFVLSAGGFHPRYTRPPGVPALRRLAMDLGGGLGLRAEAYFAVTSNAVQFGAKVQLDAEIAGCGVQGWLGLDALFVFTPVFFFSVHVYAGVAVLAFGERLASVGLDFTLEGPGQWHAFGTGSISLLFWDVSLDFDVCWGPAVAQPALTFDLRKELATALALPQAWSVRQPPQDRTALSFTRDARQRLGAGTLTHPDAVLKVSQSVLPLDEPVTRFHRTPIPEQTWTVTGASLGDGPLPVGTANVATDRFVPAEFFTMTEDQQLGAAAFKTCRSGVLFSAGDGMVLLTEPRQVGDGYETGYKPEVNVAPQVSTRAHRFGFEDMARMVSVAERLERWRTVDALVKVAP